MRRLVLPSPAVLSEVTGGRSTYALRNYYRHGPVALAKRHRFRVALALANRYAPERNVALDIGMCDGFFLPTLARDYAHTVGIDVEEVFCRHAAALISALSLTNTEVLCTSGMDWVAIRRRVGKEADVAFVLETLEHVGERDRPWESRAEFVAGCLSLLRPGGVVIVSVPKMVGPWLILKSIVQKVLRLQGDGLSLLELVRAGLLYDTSALESRWSGGHVGFNHRKLESALRKRFHVLERRESLMSAFYAVTAT